MSELQSKLVNYSFTINGSIMLPRRLSYAAAGCVVLFLITLSGCSIHPLPGDIPRVATVDIVERMRCEAQEGLAKVMNEPYRNKKVDAQIYDFTSIGYDFFFDITEGNNDGVADVKGSNGSLTLERLKSGGGGSFTLGLTASALNKRQNVRRFRIIETFKDLAKADCSRQATEANWVYPITGATGIDEIVRTYFKIERLADLQDDPPTPPAGNVGNPFGATSDNVVFSDILKFTTTLSASATPHLVLNAPVGSLRVKEAIFAAAATRSDNHNVIVAIARDKDKIKIIRDPATGVLRRIAAPPPTLREAAVKRAQMIKQGAVIDSRVVTALIQKDAVAHNRVLIELQRLRDLEDDQREAPRLLGERFLEVMRTP